MASWLARRIVDPLSAGLAFAAYHGIRALPVDLASALGGRLGRLIGPLLPPHKVARANLRAAFPEKSDAERADILSRMWENLGRTFFEYPHQQTLLRLGRVDMVGLEYAVAMRDDGETGLMWSAHTGNWELVSAAAGAVGLEMHRIYRRPNNPHLEWLFLAHRDLAKGELLPKGADGARRALVLLRKGGHLAMMIDQKMNDGIAVPFFGRAAMTASALAVFALRFSCPLVAARVVRLRGAHFRLEILPPYRLNATGDQKADILAAMTAVNRTLEGWIREHPEQWLWVHRRWPKA